MGSITQKQKDFADYYIETGNAEEAARRAGYSARGNTTKLLQNTTIREYLKQRNKQLETPRIASMTEVKEFWTNMLRNDNVEPKDRLKASEYIAKTNGAFIDRTEHSGAFGVKIVNNVPRNSN